jgi:hypothetical protein
LFSVGGNDRTALVWEVKGIEVVGKEVEEELD